MHLWVTFGGLYFIQIYFNKFLFQFLWRCLEYPKITLASTRQNIKIYGQEFGHAQPLMWQCICLHNMVNWQCQTIFWAANTIYSVGQHPMAQKKNCDKRRQKNLPKLLPKIPAESRWPTIEDIQAILGHSKTNIQPTEENGGHGKASSSIS